MTGWTEEDLTRAWRALGMRHGDEEWRLVNLTTINLVSVQAGRHFPDSREALIVAFPVGWLGKLPGLPNGKGFEAALIEGHPSFERKDVIALIRKLEGAFDIFAIMVVDLLQYLENTNAKDPKTLVSGFLQRVRDWQNFMSRGVKPLSFEAQAGLYGELITLQMLCEIMPGGSAFDAWKGPMHAAQDFHLGSGALEVKTTSTTDVFKARINSIEQLDSDRQPMFLGAVRLKEDAEGKSLNTLVEQLREVADTRARRRSFEALLIMAGYYDEHASNYERSLSVDELRCFNVNAEFPVLRRINLPIQITAAHYTLDLSAISQADIEMGAALKALGISE